VWKLSLNSNSSSRTRAVEPRSGNCCESASKATWQCTPQQSFCSQRAYHRWRLSWQEPSIANRWTKRLVRERKSSNFRESAYSRDMVALSNLAPCRARSRVSPTRPSTTRQPACLVNLIDLHTLQISNPPGTNYHIACRQRCRTLNNMAIEPEKKLFGHAVFAFVINKDLPESQALAVRYLRDSLMADF